MLPMSLRVCDECPFLCARSQLQTSHHVWHCTCFSCCEQDLRKHLASEHRRRKDGNDIMRILIVGAGAVGSYFGGRLIQAGRDVTFLVRPKRAEGIRHHCLPILSPKYGDFTVRPNAITATQLESPYDVILLSLKGYNLAAAMDDCTPAIGPQTSIVPTLNGMRHIDALTAKCGEGPVLGGVCFVSTEIDSEGESSSYPISRVSVTPNSIGRRPLESNQYIKLFRELDLTHPFPPTVCGRCGRSGYG